MTDNAPRSNALYFKEGASDKEYIVNLIQKDDGWVCDFAYGRRGKALKTGTKTKEPVSWEQANKEYEKLVKSKTSKGYTQAESGIKYVGTALESQNSGLVPSLPTAMKDSDLEAYMGDNRYVMQEKQDGENRMLMIKGKKVIGSNRRGLITAVREDWDIKDIPLSEKRYVFCGEDLGDTYAVFDIIEINGTDITAKSMEERYEILTNLIPQPPKWMKIVKTATGEDAKRAMFKKIEKNQGEGVVFKLAEASYEEGRTKNLMKYKIQESATFIVTRINEQRSVALGLYNDAEIIENLGNVTIPQNQGIPEIGDLVEVGYMYRFDNGALEQPKYKGKRTDLGQMKPKTSQIQRCKRKMAA